ncbi:MFS transporter [Rhodopila globiformis]|uniref:MFS transporter n=1 Tax=Rhodopila globiformis TaxID=1071 RepID=A0A2S6N1I9_RHOGL|nr:MFS transporter [Rhodopila globiformis]PPQ28456.1 MFS transporter [Rhodopila globiformis]
MGSSVATTPGSPVVAPIERETIRHVTRRLIPLLMVSYFVAYLDRVNVGFASLSMNKDLGFSAEIYGIGSGIFFFGYFLAEIPSNLILSKVGARRWIARILITWGVISGLTALVRGTWSFLGIRFLLGLAEAGFYPGIILYLTWWFPSYYRSRIIGLFMTAIPISIVTGSLVSSQILRLGAWGGLADWQWLFILEAVPAAILGVVVMVYLTDGPEQAKWLAPEQRTWLIKRLAAERAQRESIRDYSLGETMRNPRVWLLTLVYFGQNVAGYGLVLFLPQIVHRFGVGVGVNGLLSALPYAFAAVAMVLWGLHSDRTGERSLHTAAACFLNFAGLAVCIFLHSPVLLMIAIILSQMGQAAIAPTFWTLPTAMLSGTAAAGGIALINAVGNLGGFLGPYMMGAIKDATGSFNIGLLSIAMGTLVAGIILVALGHDRRLEATPEEAGHAAAGYTKPQLG